MAATLTTIDPAAFVAEAERITNEYDLDAAIAAYTADAVYENVSDGLHERHVGTEAIAAAWRVNLGVARDTGVHITKRLVAAEGDTIANEWHGRTRDGRVMRGLEYWRLTEEGKVHEHVMLGFLSVKPSTDLFARLRFLAASPRAALAFVRHDRRR